MPRHTKLDTQWQALMSLCAMEKEYMTEHRHPKLLPLITEQIDQLAADMGFGARQINGREFRAEKDGESITRIIVD
jgi:hypothetical protein